jgi:hypothetical protein
MILINRGFFSTKQEFLFQVDARVMIISRGYSDPDQLWVTAKVVNLVHVHCVFDTNL